MIKKLFLAALLVTNIAQAQVLNSAVTQANIQNTICVSKWSQKVRPSVTITNKIKKQKLAEAGIPFSDTNKYELDHIVNISIGGSPTDPKNMQLQLWDGDLGARNKDIVETRMWRFVCSGKITLAKAQFCMYNNWKACPTK